MFNRRFRHVKRQLDAMREVLRARETKENEDGEYERTREKKREQKQTIN